MDKTIHDIFKLGSTAVFYEKKYILEEIMILGTSERLYTVLRFSAENGKNIVYGVDIETNTIFPLTSEQNELYQENLRLHKKRLLNNDTIKILDYKSNCYVDKYEYIIQKIVTQSNLKQISSKILLNEKDYIISWFSFLCNEQGDSLLVSISEEEMVDNLSMQALYNDLDLMISLSEYDLKYRGNIVRIEKIDAKYLLYIHPYPMEIMQSTQSKGASFENISNPFSIMDFVVNYADSDVNGVIYPNSDDKPIHNYIVVGVLKNIDIDIEDCVIGSVRVGNQIDVSKKFKDSISDLIGENNTL